MDYFEPCGCMELSDDELYCILFAFERGKKNSLNLCCHAHERGFLSRYDWLLIHGFISQERSISLLWYLNSGLEYLTRNNPSVKDLSLELMEVTKTKHCFEELLFLAHLLIDCHDANDCSKYMSLALKFYLDGYDNLCGQFRFLNKPARVLRELKINLKYIASNKLETSLFIMFTKIFLTRYEDLRPGRHLEEDCRIYRDVCDISHNYLNFDFLTFMKSGNNRLAKCFVQCSILLNFRRYSVLTHFGYEDHYFKGAVDRYRDAITTFDPDLWRSFPTIIKEEEENLVMYRSYQVLYLYVKFIRIPEARDSKMSEEILRLLWNTIPDPYLTRKRFLSSFQDLQIEDRPKVRKAWEWYAQNMRINKHHQLTPRSLMHMSRCQLRKVATPCTKFLSNVKYLEVPVALKNYLALEY